MPTTRKQGSSLGLVFATIVFCLGALAGAWWLWQQGAAASRLDSSSMMTRINTIQETTSEIWTKRLEHELILLANQELLQHFADDVTFMGLEPHMLTALTGTEQTRRSLLALLAPRKSEQELAKIKEMGVRLESVKAKLVSFQHRYRFLSLNLVSSNGFICASTSLRPKQLGAAERDIFKDCLRNLKPVALPAYRQDQKLCLDFVVPMLTYEQRASQPRCVGLLLASIDLGETLTKVQEAITALDKDAFWLVAQEQSDGNINMLTATGNNASVPLAGWRSKHGFLPLDVRSVSGFGRSYTSGTRFMDTSIYVIHGLAASPAITIGKNWQQQVVAGVLVCAAVLVMLLLWSYLLTKRTRQKAQALRANLEGDLSRRQLLGYIDRDLGLAVVCCSFDKTILFVNQSFASLCGQEVSALEGQPLSALPADVVDSLNQHAALVWESGAVQRSQDTFKMLSKRSFTSYTCPYIDGQGYMSGIIAIYQDISMHSEAKRKNEQLLAAFQRLILAMDPYLGKLSLVVANLATVIARLDGDESKETVRTLFVAGRLCTLGKLIELHVVRKDGLSKEDEQRIVRREIHAVTSVLESIDFGPLPIAQAIGDMYERLDGSGLPRGIKGEEISKPARYLGIAMEICVALRPRSGQAQDLETFLDKTFIQQPDRFDPVAIKLARFLRTPSGDKVLEKIRRF